MKNKNAEKWDCSIDLDHVFFIEISSLFFYFLPSNVAARHTGSYVALYKL